MIDNQNLLLILQLTEIYKVIYKGNAAVWYELLNCYIITDFLTNVLQNNLPSK